MRVPDQPPVRVPKALILVFYNLNEANLSQQSYWDEGKRAQRSKTLLKDFGLLACISCSPGIRTLTHRFGPLAYNFSLKVRIWALKLRLGLYDGIRASWLRFRPEENETEDDKFPHM